jgi:HAE1 family hydrophobic/amphiphilic exporter-1
MSRFPISAWSIRNPIPVAIIFIALMLAGITSYQRLAIKQFPDISFPLVVVTVVQPGAAPTELNTRWRKSSRTRSRASRGWTTSPRR